MQEFATRKTIARRMDLRPLNCLLRKYRMAVRIMKLTAIILLAACLQLSAEGITQTVTISVKDAPLLSVLKAIEKQTDFVFFVNSKELKRAKDITITAKNLPLLQVLDMCFKDQPLTYAITGKWINIVPRIVKVEKDDNKTSLMPPLPKKIDVSGKVSDENGTPLAGANVVEKGKQHGVTTNTDGAFVLKGVDENGSLEISYIGYQTLTIPINRRTSIIVSIERKQFDLQEVVINKGYYTEKAKFSTGNVVSVKTKDIAKQPVNNPLLALVARVPGLQVEQVTGYANSAVKVRIQGTNSLAAGLDPLYVIDEVPYGSLLIPSSGRGSILGSYTSNGVFAVGNPLSFLNPGDIESIDVLKDADAISIYGSRGANGVILITTKKGRAGKVKVDVNMRTGWGQITNKMKLLNAEQYLTMRKEGYRNDGLSVPDNTSAPNNNNYDLTVWDQDRFTDWQDVLIGGTARYTDAQVSLSGGNANTQFLISPGYHKETTIFPGDFSDQKGSLNFNISHTDNKQKFKAQLSGTYVVDDNQLPQTDLTQHAVSLAPNAPKIYNEDGTLNWAPIVSGTGTVSTWTNPFSFLENKYSTKANNLISNALLSYKILPGLSISSSFGYSNLQTKELGTNALTAVRPESRATSMRTALYSNGYATNWIIEPQVSYASNLGKGKIEALVGATFQQSNMDYQAFTGSGYSSDLLLKDIKSASSITASSTVSNIFRYNAVYGRLNYNLANKYIANFTARRDGSSRFGSENLFANFYSMAGAWIFSNERILANSNILSFGKLRVSYGISGNDQIGEYGFMNLYNSVSQGVPYQGIPVMQPAGHTNPYLQWEETSKLQFGLDFGLLKDRIQLNVNYYFNRSSNLIVQTALSSNTGYPSVNSNFEGIVQNKGWELALNTTNFRSNNFTWTSSINFTIPVDNGVLKSFPALENSVYASLYAIGKSILNSKRYYSLGVDPATGKYIFEDVNGNPTFSPITEDRNRFVNISQLLYGGMQNVFHYKDFELDFTLQFVKRNAALPFNSNSYPGYFDGLGNRGNQPELVLDRWQKIDDMALFQRFTGTRPSDMQTSQLNFISSDRAYVDASYIKLTTASISWSLPSRWEKAMRLQNASLFVQGQNLFTIDKYKSLDASTGSFTTLPPIRVVTVGCQISL